MTALKTLTFTEVEAGDVLLCRPLAPNCLQRKIIQESGSPYTHAAIVINSDVVPPRIADARFLVSDRFGSVKDRPLCDLLGLNDYAIVLRSSLGWDASAVRRLQCFVQVLQKRGTKYNWPSLYNFAKRKMKYDDGLMDAIRRYFAEPKKPTEIAGKYFCSELIVSCFEFAGLIGQSATVLLNPRTTAPGDLAKEPVFGHPVGYLSSNPTFTIPSDDPLRSRAEHHGYYAIMG